MELACWPALMTTLWSCMTSLLISIKATICHFKAAVWRRSTRPWKSKKGNLFMITVGIRTCLHGTQKLACKDLIFIWCIISEITISWFFQTSEYCQKQSHSSVGCLQRKTGFNLPCLQQVLLHSCAYIEYSIHSQSYSVDEVEAATCISISPDGEKLYCGFDKCVRVFDIKTPGRECEVRPTKCMTKTILQIFLIL